MATSFVSFKQKGFWCEDAYLETWLYFFIEEAKQLDDTTEEWLMEVRDNWYRQATAGFIGSIELELDKIIVSENRKNVLEDIAIKTNQRLDSYGEFLSHDLLNTFVPKGKLWTQSPETSRFIKVGIFFIELINVKLPFTVSSPLDYLKSENWMNLNLRW